VRLNKKISHDIIFTNVIVRWRENEENSIFFVGIYFLC
jgi:hypothetical protein